MKRYFLNFIILNFCLSILFACEKKGSTTNDFIKSYFVNEFPDKEYNLTKKPGEYLHIARKYDTLHLNISFNKTLRTTTIVDTVDKDTIFSGKVYKYKGLYFFSRKIEDSVYWISAVKIKRDYIQGLGDDYWQMYLIDHLLDSDSSETSLLQPLLIKNKPDYALSSDRKILAKYYSSIVDSFPKMTRIYPGDESINIGKDEREDDIEEENKLETENPLIQKYYPNPVDDILNIETNYISEYAIIVSNDQNRILIKDKFSGNKKSLSMVSLRGGSYIVQITSEKLNKSEAVKVIVR